MSDAALSLSLLEDEAPTPGHRGFETAREVRRLEAELVSLEQRRDRARRHLEAEDPDSPTGQAALQLARDLADDLLRNGRDQLRLAHRAAEQAAAARVAVAVREAHDRLAEARADIARAVEERAAFAETVANLSPGEIAELVPVTRLRSTQPPAEAPASAQAPAAETRGGPRGPRRRRAATGVGPTGRRPEPLAGHGRCRPRRLVARVGRRRARRSVRARSPSARGRRRRPAGGHGAAPACTVTARRCSTRSGQRVARDADEFWDEQESTRSRAWVRPLEIVLPMVAAAVLVVLLLLVLG